MLLQSYSLENPETHCSTFSLELQTFKWQEYISWQGKINEAKASAAALKASINGMSTEGKPPESKCRAFFRKSPLEDVQVVKNNIYDKGFFHNLHEIIFPPSMRSSFLQSKSKSGWIAFILLLGWVFLRCFGGLVSLFLKLLICRWPAKELWGMIVNEIAFSCIAYHWNYNLWLWPIAC